MRFTCIAVAAVALALAKPYPGQGPVSRNTYTTYALSAETRTPTTSTSNASAPSASHAASNSSITTAAHGAIDFTPLPSADAAAGGRARGGTTLSPQNDPDRCATIQRTEHGPTLVVAECASGMAQTFTLTDGEIRAGAEMCVTAPDQRDNAVRRVTLELCDGSAAQRWVTTDDGEYRGYRGKCLTAAGPPLRAGTPVAVRACMGRMDQRWAQRQVRTLHSQVDSIRLSAVALSLGSGTSSRVNATAIDADGHEVGEVVTWASSDPSVAAVSTDGTVTGVSGGSTTVIAMSQGRVKGITVEVRSAQYAGLESGTATHGAEKQQP
jgi:hypothetical protein